MADCRSVNILLIGTEGAGKTSLVRAFFDKPMLEAMPSTLTIDFETKLVELRDGTSVNVQVWDTPGDERFRGTTKLHYREAECCVLVYNMSKQPNQHSAEASISEFLEVIGPMLPPPPIFIVCNKLPNSKVRVNYNKLKEIADARNCTLCMFPSDEGEEAHKLLMEMTERANECYFARKAFLEEDDERQRFSLASQQPVKQSADRGCCCQTF